MGAFSLPQGSQWRLSRGGKAESAFPNDEFTMQAEAWQGILACAEAQRHKRTLTAGC